MRGAGMLRFSAALVAVCACVISLAGCPKRAPLKPDATAVVKPPPPPPAPPPPRELRLKGVGLMTPESVLHDPEQDVYLVSNINGDPLGVDGNGFISRVSPAGELLALKWIDGAAKGVTLNAPKGMAAFGERLYVADITCVRIFDRKTGAPKGEVTLPGATFVNDLVAAADGTIYASDSGKTTGFKPSGTDAIWRIAGDKAERIVADTGLGHPNGLVLDGDQLVVVTMGTGEIYRLAEKKRVDVRKAPTGSLDGIERLPDGDFLVSSWEGKKVYRVSKKDGAFTVVASDLESPADIGHDAKRSRLLVPLFNANELVILPLPR